MKILRKKMAMFMRWFRIISHRSATAVRQKKGTKYCIHEIRGYYNDLTGKVSENTILDNHGITLTKIDGNEYVYFPIAIFQYALGCYDMYLIKSDKKFLDRFLKNADWALEQQKKNGEWDCFGPLKSSKYTVSSMAQGEGISVLCRAYVITGEIKYLDAAKKAADFMLLPLSDGGTAVYSGIDLYLEEYPQTIRRGVLNGWIFSIFGLYDIQLLDAAYQKMFERTCLSLIKEIRNYDTGYWSYYDLEKNVASPAYHDLHIALLRVLNELYPSEIFEDYANKFEKYQKNFIKVTQAICIKFKQKMFEKPDCIVIQ